MKITKKFMTTVGTLATMTSPLATVVACEEKTTIDNSILGRADRFFGESFYANVVWADLDNIENDHSFDEVLEISGAIEEFEYDVHIPVYQDGDESEWIMSQSLGGVTLDSVGRSITVEVQLLEYPVDENGDYTKDEDGNIIRTIHSFFWKIVAGDFSPKLSDFRAQLSNKNKISHMDTYELEAFVDDHNWGSDTSVTVLENELQFQYKLSEKLLDDTLTNTDGETYYKTYYFPSVRVSRLSSIQRAYSVNFSVYSRDKDADGDLIGSAQFEFSISFTLLASDIADEL